jgi:hypothetical protein
MEKGLTRNQVISILSKSPHGTLSEYVPIGQAAAKSDPDFYAHLIAWNAKNGQIRDAKVALPVVSLAPGINMPEDLAENSLAHFVSQGPRELLRAYRFALDLRGPIPAYSTKRNSRQPGYMLKMKNIVAQYLHEKEEGRSWDGFAVLHRNTLRELYALTHTQPLTDRANIVLFHRDLRKNKMPMPAGSVFEVVTQLKNMAPIEAAGAILEYKIPFLIAFQVLGEKAKDPDILLALIERMSPTELVTNAAVLERAGVQKNPALRGAFEKALEKAATSKKNVLKTTAAASAKSVKSDVVREKLRGLQEKQMENISVQGNWLILGDKSSSMAQSIEVARHIAATLAGMVKGKVWLTFFNDSPQTIDVTGASLDVIQKATRHIRAGGNTSIGCGLHRMLIEKQEVDGIVIVSDGGDNSSPLFHQVYPKYAEFVGKEVPVYLYLCEGMDGNALGRNMANAGLDMQTFDIGNTIDYYSLPNLVKTMRTNQYSLVDEIMATPLLSLSDVLKFSREEVAA